MATTRTAKKTDTTTMSAYAAQNKSRQLEWEPGFRRRIEQIIQEQGGPGKVQDATRIKSQTLQKIRKGGSRLALFAIFCDAFGVNVNWLLLGSASEMPYRGRALGVVIDEEVSRIAVPELRPSAKRKSSREKTEAPDRATKRVGARSTPRKKQLASVGRVR